ncbi:(1-_4)-alpha-D-glucan synthase (UDP-glucose) [Algoriphagus boseongensis]|uniref:(1->4)-alpha-D-glucan synthase (UDP-glucose) n=1 Tax=Algoriphagus boseongensis TaxID=1442587 RepID=A0A4R6T765_9BACT|nr:glycosyltransferase family 4 protein [Algoriphagus boseongensis]TDQ17055.1 (1->4)-alpha-D-glucan synthase (UDP-glucose) [Algoriphagus boseongensis]
MNKSLKIVMICKSLPWRFKGGIQTHTWDLAKALTGLGHQVTVLTGGNFSKAENRYSKDEVSVVEIPFFPGRYLPGIAYLAEELSFNIQVKRWVKKNADRFDIIHAQGRSGYLLYQIKGIQGKLVNTVHGLTQIEAKSGKTLKDFNASLHAFFSKKWEIKLLQASRGAIAVSENLKSSLSLNSPSQMNLRVIPNGVEAPKELLQVAPSTKIVDRFVFVGRLHPVKGLDRIVKALAKNDRKIHLDIIGTGPQEKELKQLVQDLGLEKQVRFLGEYDSASIHFLMPYYKGLVLPSLYESQGIVLLEANVHGVPVIASDLEPIRETVTSEVNGILCNPEKPEDYIKAMEYFLDHPVAARNMGLRGLELVKASYSWNSVAEKTIEFYHQIAS